MIATLYFYFLQRPNRTQYSNCAALIVTMLTALVIFGAPLSTPLFAQIFGSRTCHAVQYVTNFSGQPILVRLKGLFLQDPNVPTVPIAYTYKPNAAEGEWNVVATIANGQTFHAWSKDRITSGHTRHYTLEILFLNESPLPGEPPMALETTSFQWKVKENLQGISQCHEELWSGRAARSVSRIYERGGAIPEGRSWEKMLEQGLIDGGLLVGGVYLAKTGKGIGVAAGAVAKIWQDFGSQIATGNLWKTKPDHAYAAYVVSNLDTTTSIPVSIEPGVQYRLKNHRSGLYLGVGDFSTKSGGTARQWDLSEHQDRENEWERSTAWTFQDLADETYKIVNVHSGHYLGIDNFSNKSDADARQWSAQDFETRRHDEWDESTTWYIARKELGNITIRNKKSGHYLAIDNFGMGDGKKGRQYSEAEYGHRADFQMSRQWSLQPINTANK